MADSLRLGFATEVFALEAIKKSAYRLSDVMTVDINPSQDVVECILYPRSPSTADELENLAHAFRAEVLDQDLRMLVATETAPLRNAILAYAFSKTGLQGGE